MPYDLITIPCLSDNYAYLLRDHDSGEVAVIDVPEAGPILKELENRGWSATQIWLTHHHWDHIDGVPDLLAVHPAKVVGGKADAHRLPKLDQAVSEGDTVSLGALEAQVLDVSGHTIGHIALYVPKASLAFTADSLMALGCGRLFEGTPEQMWNSMQKLMALPADTTICSGHEYTASNAKFALTVDPANAALISRSTDIQAARDKGLPTVPSKLSTELETNPFLRPADPGIRATLGMQDATDAAVFKEIRKRKDSF
ncbi:hydroxyacylglutathione hydrolase [Sulfitobacter mediterraneus]|uniref:hydroxyacylglutathione hydrolase n=1 Tax=Sulfitobacter mediterraneus TaxID=83219 RepID=UPI00193A3856|nr:hydroxyacylglutathione hydrolase [Sulfitobacter mediterraneus]MBM1556018.1 hydroxyacylglutathione hydrolase [Sulfitobacter mediterraneus]MBM1567944.1 hydroxyacylglutathione hydrolase [Sulfitobacter mediterraneus]MBM1571372.1 hydroxyacylglutathione hydrolase [Sulfitobacter mediterraneus]MBM1575160.1 hydroxyacylglutathione hydrolase [Sulfitobacter mediterraneus]MBM1579349.1 hydroxyacylglutathione hydrolase [Sulfitobacter mediterraneus]